MNFAPPSRSVSAIYCDDVREEAGGKLSYMGIYRGDMIVAAPFPTALPKMMVIAIYAEPTSEVWLPVKVRVYGPDRSEDADPSMEFEVPYDPSAEALIPGDSLENKMRQIVMPVVFAPFIIPAPGKVRLHFERDGVVYRAGALSVQSAEGSPPAE